MSEKIIASDAVRKDTFRTPSPSPSRVDVATGVQNREALPHRRPGPRTTHPSTAEFPRAVGARIHSRSNPVIITEACSMHCACTESLMAAGFFTFGANTQGLLLANYATRDLVPGQG